MADNIKAPPTSPRPAITNRTATLQRSINLQENFFTIQCSKLSTCLRHLCWRWRCAPLLYTVTCGHWHASQPSLLHSKCPKSSKTKVFSVVANRTTPAYSAAFCAANSTALAVAFTVRPLLVTFAGGGGPGKRVTCRFLVGDRRPASPPSS
jgi:hypothetical protein